MVEHVLQHCPVLQIHRDSHHTYALEHLWERPEKFIDYLRDISHTYFQTTKLEGGAGRGTDASMGAAEHPPSCRGGLLETPEATLLLLLLRCVCGAGSLLPFTIFSSDKN